MDLKTLAIILFPSETWANHDGVITNNPPDFMNPWTFNPMTSAEDMQAVYFYLWQKSIFLATDVNGNMRAFQTLRSDRFDRREADFRIVTPVTNMPEQFIAVYAATILAKEDLRKLQELKL